MKDKFRLTKGWEKRCIMPVGLVGVAVLLVLIGCGRRDAPANSGALNEGYRRFAAGDWQAAIAELETACVQRPKDAQLADRLAKAYQFTGHYPRAEATLQAFIDTATGTPSAANALADLAKWRFWRGELERAQQYIEQACALAPDSRDCLRWSGYLAWCQGAHGRALALFRQAGKALNDPGFARLEVEGLIAQGSREAALAAGRAAVATYPDAPEAYKAACLALEREGLFDEAGELLEGWVNRSGRTSPALLCQVWYLFRRAQFESGLRCLMEGAGQLPEPEPESLARIFEYGLLCERWELAEEALAIAGQRRPDDPWFHQYHAQLALDRGDLERARQWTELSLVVMPGQPMPLVLQARYQWLTGQPETAVKTAREALAAICLSCGEYVYYWAAEVLRQSGEAAAAKELYQGIVERNVEWHYVELARRKLAELS